MLRTIFEPIRSQLLVKCQLCFFLYIHVKASEALFWLRLTDILLKLKNLLGVLTGRTAGDFLALNKRNCNLIFPNGTVERSFHSSMSRVRGFRFYNWQIEPLEKKSSDFLAKNFKL